MTKRKAPKYIPTTAISPGIGEKADPDMRVELSYAKVTSRHYRPPVNVPEEVVEKFPEYKEETTDKEKH